MTRVVLVKPLSFITFTNETVIVVCMNLMTADVESERPPAAGPLKWIFTIKRAWLSVTIVAEGIWLSVCMIKMDDMSGATPKRPNEVVQLPALAVIDCTGTDLGCIVLQTTAKEVLFNREGNLSMSVLNTAPVTGEKVEVGGTEMLIVKILRLPVALSKVAFMVKIRLTEINSRTE